MGICFQDDKPKVKPIVLKPEEQAILDCKKCRDKIKNYIKRLSERQNKSRAKAKELLADKQRDRAKFYLRQAKLHEAQINTHYGQLEMVEKQISQIESATNLQDIMKVLQNGNEVLKKMQDTVKLDEWEKIKDDMDELKEKDKEIGDFLREYGINQAEYDNDVNNDFEKLMNEVKGNKAKDDIKLPEVPKEEITEDKEKNAEKNKTKKKVVEA